MSSPIPQSAADIPGRGYNCLTCRLTFQTLDILKDHYRLDLHRCNLKRKVNGLAPLSQAELDVRETEQEDSRIPEIRLAAPGGKEKHAKKRNKEEKNRHRTEARVAKREQKMLRAKESFERQEARHKADMAGLDGMNEEEAAEHVITERMKLAPQRGFTQCIFSGKQFETSDAALTHMAKYVSAESERRGAFILSFLFAFLHV
jgi:pre-60S factor REI1